MNCSPSRTVTDRSIPGGWSERAFAVGKRELRLLVPAHPDEFLEGLEESVVGIQEPDPYWAELWPSSLRMTRGVYRASWPANTRTLELGCGIGVVGLAALVAGLDVTMTDRVEIAVDTAVENAQRNGFHDARGFVLDWSSPPLLEFPLILASDVLYDRALHTHLLRTITAMLSRGGECWIGDPGRSATEAFLGRIAQSDYSVRLLDQSGCEVTRLELGEFRLIILQRR